MTGTALVDPGAHRAHVGRRDESRIEPPEQVVVVAAARHDVEPAGHRRCGHGGRQQPAAAVVDQHARALQQRADAPRQPPVQRDDRESQRPRRRSRRLQPGVHPARGELRLGLPVGRVQDLRHRGAGSAGSAAGAWRDGPVGAGAAPGGTPLAQRQRRHGVAPQFGPGQGQHRGLVAHRRPVRLEPQQRVRGLPLRECRPQVPLERVRRLPADPGHDGALCRPRVGQRIELRQPLRHGVRAAHRGANGLEQRQVLAHPRRCGRRTECLLQRRIGGIEPPGAPRHGHGVEHLQQARRESQSLRRRAPEHQTGGAVVERAQQRQQSPDRFDRALRGELGRPLLERLHARGRPRAPCHAEAACQRSLHRRDQRAPRNDDRKRPLRPGTRLRGRAARVAAAQPGCDRGHGSVPERIAAGALRHESRADRRRVIASRMHPAMVIYAIRRARA